MVEHNPSANRFEINQDGHQCLLEYTLAGNSIDFNHTYVPDELRGKGLAGIIVKEGLAWAREQGYDIHASCSYVQKVLERERR